MELYFHSHSTSPWRDSSLSNGFGFMEWHLIKRRDKVTFYFKFHCSKSETEVAMRSSLKLDFEMHVQDNAIRTLP